MVEILDRLPSDIWKIIFDDIRYKFWQIRFVCKEVDRSTYSHFLQLCRYFELALYLCCSLSAIDRECETGVLWNILEKALQLQRMEHRRTNQQLPSFHQLDDTFENGLFRWSPNSPQPRATKRSASSHQVGPTSHRSDLQTIDICKFLISFPPPTPPLAYSGNGLLTVYSW